MHFKIKHIKGIRYLYLIENARINGKVKQVKQICIGNADKIEQMYNGQLDVKIKSFPFGKVAALMHAAQKLDLINIIDSVVDKKDIAGLSVGEYILTLVSARAEGVPSRRKVEKWFNKSSIQFLLSPHYQLSSQNFLNQMKRLNDRAIDQIEIAICKNLVKMGISPTRLIFDTPNRYTFIEHGEDLPRKGRDKHKRYDKNTVGVGLVTSDANIPFMSDVYPGNETDSKLFHRIFESLCRRIETIGIDTNELTLIIDRGFNSEDNLDELVDKMHVVGALPRNISGDLLETPLSEFEDVYTNSNKNIIKGCRTRGTYYGQEFDVVVQYNPATKTKQMKAFMDKKLKIMEGFDKLRKSCLRKGKGRKPSEKGIINKIADLVGKELRGLFDYGIVTADNGRPCPWFEVDEKFEKKRILSFGKTAVFTDMKELSTKDILLAYNSKYMVEEDFKWFNDKTIIPFWPLNVLNIKWMCELTDSEVNSVYTDPQ
jgi:transposase